MNPIPEKYQPIIKILRDTLVEAGGYPMYRAEDYGVNEFYPSISGKIELVTDYGVVHELRVPEGTITPFGSFSVGNAARMMELLQERLGLQVLIPQRDDRKIGYLEYQLSPSGPVFEVTKPVATQFASSVASSVA